jgi:hypothetical protein
MLIDRTTFEAGDSESETIIADSSERPLTQAELAEFFRASPKFRAWKPKKSVRTSKTPAGRVGEEHFSPRDLATKWGVSEKVVRNVFRNEEGVLKIGRNGSRSRQGYWTLRIPQSVAERVHRRLSA